MKNDFSIILATLKDYPLIQNMARFYVYDLSRECGYISSDWQLPEDGLYESFDFKNYFEDLSRKAYLVKISNEIAGFVLLNQATEDKTNNWNIGEFFIIAKFQGRGIGERVAHRIWEMHPGTWEVAVIPENKKGQLFWEKAIRGFTGGIFNKTLQEVAYDTHQPKRIIFTFDTKAKTPKNLELQILVCPSNTDDIDDLVSMSKVKRLNYEKAQPHFWRYAGPHAEKSQAKWFKELLISKDHIMLTAKTDNKTVGFIIGKLIQAPEVYNPNGWTLMVDDFCVESEGLWYSVGTKLIESIKYQAQLRGAAQILMVCGAHDHPKRYFLMSQKLIITSEWFVGSII